MAAMVGSTLDTIQGALGFTSGDLTGQYFQASNFTFASVDGNGNVTITVTAPAGLKHQQSFGSKRDRAALSHSVAVLPAKAISWQKCALYHVSGFGARQPFPTVYGRACAETLRLQGRPRDSTGREQWWSWVHSGGALRTYDLSDLYVGVCVAESSFSVLIDFLPPSFSCRI